MKRRRALSILAAAGLAGCSRDPESQSHLQVSASRQLSMSSLHLAQESGYFSDEGLDLEIVQIRGSTNALPLVAGGEIDAALSAISVTFVNAVARGANVRIVAGREVASPDCGFIGSLYGRREAFPNGLEDARALRGKRVGSDRSAALIEFSLDLHLSAAGMTRDDLNIILMDSREAIGALAGGHVDAIVSNHEYDADLSERSDKIIRGPGISKYKPGFQYSFIYFGQKIREGDPEIGARFLAAYLRGAQDFVAGRTPAFMREFAEEGGMDVEAAVSACRNRFSLDGKPDLDSLAFYLDWAVRAGHCQLPVAAAELVDTSYLDRAHAVAGEAASARMKTTMGQIRG